MSSAAVSASKPVFGKKLFGLVRYKHVFMIFFILIFLVGSGMEAKEEGKAYIFVEKIFKAVTQMDTNIKNAITGIREKEELLGRNLNFFQLIFPTFIIIGSIYTYYYWFLLIKAGFNFIVSDAGSSKMAELIIFAVFIFIIQFTGNILTTNLAGGTIDLTDNKIWVDSVPFNGFWHQDGLLWNIDIFVEPLNRYNPFGNPHSDSINASDTGEAFVNDTVDSLSPMYDVEVVL